MKYVDIYIIVDLLTLGDNFISLFLTDIQYHLFLVNIWYFLNVISNIVFEALKPSVYALNIVHKAIKESNTLSLLIWIKIETFKDAYKIRL